MNLLNIGQIIKSERIKKCISQEELAFGICTTATLSRLENNLHTPTRSICTALLDKIGSLGYLSCSLYDNYNPSITNNNNLFNEVYLDIENKNFDNLNSFSENIKEYYDDSFLINQFNTAIESLSSYNKDEHTFNNTIYNSLLDSIKLTITSFSEDISLEFLLTQNEILLLFSLVIYYENSNQIIKAVNMLNNLINCVDTNYSELSFLSYSTLLRRLISLYIQNNNYTSAYSNIEKYLSFCKNHSLYYRIPDVAYYKTMCNLNLNLGAPYEPIIDAYYYYMAIDSFEKANKLKENSLSNFNFNFELVYSEVN